MIGMLLREEIIHKVMFKSLTFDGVHDPCDFGDRLAYMECYFNWYGISYMCKFRFAGMRLEGSIKIYWISIEIDRERHFKDCRFVRIDEMQVQREMLS